MSETYFVIYPNGVIKHFECDESDRLDVFHKIIGCDIVEQVHTIFDNLVIVIDESGKIKNPPQPHNPFASKLYFGWHIGVDDIVGPAILAMLHPVGKLQELDWRPLTLPELMEVFRYLGIYPVN